MSSRNDFFEESGERFRRERRKPRGRQRATDLTADTGEAGADGPQYADPLLAQLQARGHLTEIVGELKSGKEATVYAARGPHGAVAVKIYRDVGARSFRNDAMYTAGRYVSDARIRKAIETRSGRGVQAAQDMWIMHEWRELWALYLAGVPVPEPMIGPEPTMIAEAGRAVVMRFIGRLDGDSAVAAPRLSDVRLTLPDARRAWEQSLDIMARLLALGRVHGDYSTYNLLLWENTVTVIDFPQMTTRENPNFESLLRRDAESLTRSFLRHGLVEHAEVTLREVRARARRLAEREPLVQLP